MHTRTLPPLKPFTPSALQELGDLVSRWNHQFIASPTHMPDEYRKGSLAWDSRSLVRKSYNPCYTPRTDPWRTEELHWKSSSKPVAPFPVKFRRYTDGCRACIQERPDIRVYEDNILHRRDVEPVWKSSSKAVPYAPKPIRWGEGRREWIEERPDIRVYDSDSVPRHAQEVLWRPSVKAVPSSPKFKRRWQENHRDGLEERPSIRVDYASNVVHARGEETPWMSSVKPAAVHHREHGEDCNKITHRHTEPQWYRRPNRRDVFGENCRRTERSNILFSPRKPR